MIDTHMHINSVLLDNTNYFIKKINDNDELESVINIGLNINISKECIDIASKNTKFYSSVGIHPLYVKGEKCNDIYSLINDKVVAIGEIGLDTNKNNYIEQKEYLVKQIEIANNLHLPVIIHANNTNYQIIEIFNNIIKPKYGCVFHCFQPDLKVLEYLIDNGYYISFAGRITSRVAKKSLGVARTVPGTNFLLETDSPYIPPRLHKGEINESSNIKYISQRVSEIMEIPYDDIDRITTINAKRLFKKMK